MKKYEWFVSFAYINEYNRERTGRMFCKLNHNKMDSSLLNKLESTICEEMKLSKVVISNFIFLGEIEDEATIKR